MDYFDCDYFDQTYFDTPDCGGVVTPTGGHRVGITVIRRPEDEAEELMAVL